MEEKLRTRQEEKEASMKTEQKAQQYATPISSTFAIKPFYHVFASSPPFLIAIYSTDQQQYFLSVWILSSLVQQNERSSRKMTNISSYSLHPKNSVFHEQIAEARYTQLEALFDQTTNTQEDGFYQLSIFALRYPQQTCLIWNLLIDSHSFHIFEKTEKEITLTSKLSFLKPLSSYYISVEDWRHLLIRDNSFEVVNDLSDSLEDVGVLKSLMILQCFQITLNERNGAENYIFLVCERGKLLGYSLESMCQCVSFLLFESSTDETPLEVCSMTLFSVDIEDRSQVGLRAPKPLKSISIKKKQLILSIGFREGIVNKYELNPLGDDESFYSVRQTYSLDVIKEMRKRSLHVLNAQRSRSLSAIDSKDEDNNISVKKELKAVPIAMQWTAKSDLLCTSANLSMSEYLLLVLTTNGLVVTNQNLIVLSILNLSLFDMSNLSSGSIVLSQESPLTAEDDDLNSLKSSVVFLCMLSSLERKMKIMNLTAYYQANEDALSINDSVMKPPLPRARAKSPSAVRVIRNTSLDNPEDKIIAKEKVNIADQPNELDFFRICVPPSTTNTPRPVSDEDYDENECNEEGESSSSISTASRSRNLLADYSLEAKATSSTSNSGKKSGVRGNWEAPLKNAKGQIINQPVTFHTKIKSSGYGQQSNDLFQRKLEAKRKKEKEKEKEKEKKMRSTSAPKLRSNDTNTNRGPRIRSYPLDCDVTTTHQPHWDFPDLSLVSSSKGLVAGRDVGSPIFHLSYSSDATRLAIASQASVVMCLKLPRTNKNKEEVSYIGHNNGVTHVTFSHLKLSSSSSNEQQYSMISSSNDYTARLWRLSRSDTCSVLFSHHKHHSHPDSSNGLPLPTTSSPMPNSSVKRSTTMAGATPPRNRPFSSEVKQAQFFYQDKFVIMGMKSSLLMYKYDFNVNNESGNASHATNIDLTRFNHYGKYLLNYEWNFQADAQSITCLSCINSVTSPIILSSTSDKKLQVLDASEGKILRNTSLLYHEKNIHHIISPIPTAHIPLQSHHFNTFLTMSPENLLVMWDLRSFQPSCQFSNHINRRELSLQPSFSPCMKYIAVPSEDRSVRIIDLRKSSDAITSVRGGGGGGVSELYRVVTGQRDIISSVAYNPLFAQLAIGSYDGTVKFFIDPNQTIYS